MVNQFKKYYKKQYLIFQDLQPNVNTHRLLFRSTATEEPGIVQLGPNAPSSVYYRINSTSSRVLYNNENGQLYSAPISGAGATLLASDLASNSIDDFLISLDGQKTVYRTKANNITPIYIDTKRDFEFAEFLMNKNEI